MKKILLTGGAGYVGSHVLLALRAGGHDVVVLDDLSTGHKWAVGGAELVENSLLDADTLEQLLSARAFDAVLHLAASVEVAESVANPAKYYTNNTCATLALVRAMNRAGVKNLVFSSTAAVYGAPEKGVVSEDDPLEQVNPYGSSKAACEQIIKDMAAASGMRYMILRYFNVAGADPELRVGQVSRKPALLLKVACQAALGIMPGMRIFGGDYPTPDGTCVRDYIHVSDVASAHIAALDYMLQGGEPAVLNCGYGRGYSVRQVVDMVSMVSGVKMDVPIAPRRPGDPPALVASVEKIGRLLGWKPKRDDLEFIVKTALEWERKAVREGY